MSGLIIWDILFQAQLFVCNVFFSGEFIFC